MALNGIQLLLNYDIIPPSDVKNILRVLTIQANMGRSECQLKLLQIILQLANFLSRDAISSQYLTQSTICSFLTLAMQLCDARNNVSVSSTAFVTVRQIISLVFSLVHDLYNRDKVSNSFEADFDYRLNFSSASVTVSVHLLVKDIVLFLKGSPGDWIKGKILFFIIFDHITFSFCKVYIYQYLTV
jgi:hypothetical protein